MKYDYFVKDLEHTRIYVDFCGVTKRKHILVNLRTGCRSATERTSEQVECGVQDNFWP